MTPAPAWENSRLSRPVNVVGSLLTPDPAPLDPAVFNASCDVVEFRIDAYPQSVAAIRPVIAASPVPALVTVRDPREGGLNSMGLTPRHALLLSLVEEAKLVDIEIANLEAFRDVVAQARERGALVVGSFHDFRGTPEAGVLDDLVAEARALGADIVKLAVTVSRPAELVGLASMLDGAPPGSLSVMGMGPLGAVSRLLCGQLGSALNYGFLDQPSVPGQWPAAELKRLLEWIRS
jgi:3-dehydroquinate dehydratase-1